MNRDLILSLDVNSSNDENWAKAIKYFEERFNKRYFDQLDILIHHDNINIKYNCGFIIMTIDCILIETLEQFYEGKNEIKKSDLSFYNFSKRNEKLKNLFENRSDSGIFHGIVRSGLVHQAMTKKSSIINVKKKDLTIHWINENNKQLGFEINRNNFHNCVIEEYKKYVQILKNGKDLVVLENFKQKLLHIIT